MPVSTDKIAYMAAENEKCTTDAPTKKQKVNDCKLVSITLPNAGPQGLVLLVKDGGASVVIDEVIPQSQAEKYGVLAGDVPIYNKSLPVNGGVCYISYETFLQLAKNMRPFVFSVLRSVSHNMSSGSTNQPSIDEAAAPSRELTDGTCNVVHEGNIAINVANICAQERTGRWSKEEHDVFLSALQLYGKDWKKIAADIKTRTIVQTRTHAQKYFMKLQTKLNSYESEEKKISSLSKEAKTHINKWIEEHSLNPFPSRGVKDAWIKIYGIENDSQLAGYLSHARKKFKENSSLSYGGSISTVALVSETSTPSFHSVTTTSSNNNAITPGSSMKIRDNVTPPKQFVARPSKFGLKNSDGDKVATPSTYNVQTPRHGAVSDLTSIRTQWLQNLPKTAAYQKIKTPTMNNERQELDQVALDSSIAVQADTQVVSIGTLSNLNDDKPYIGSRYSPSIKPSSVVTSIDYPGCNLRGAHPLPGSAKYKSIIFYEGSRYSLGKYDFVSDAALAYDKAALSIGPYWDINFSSWDEYIATRTLEMMRKGIDQVDLTSVLEEMSSRASEVVSKVVDEAELNDSEWNKQSLGSTASDNNHDERVKAYESARALFLSHSRFSSRNMKEGEYHVQEKVYAWDRGVLYEAKVLKCKEADDEALGKMYYIHYLGYKNCHDKWLSPKDIMKLNLPNTQLYRESRGILFEEKEEVNSNNDDCSNETLLDDTEEDDGSSVISSRCHQTDSDDSEEDDTSSVSPGDCSDSEMRIARMRKLPKGVHELLSGNWQVLVYHQGRQRSIGTFQTLEQATLAREIARNMIEKDKGLQLSPEECERNFKLAKEAAWADSSDVKLQKKAKQTVYEEERRSKLQKGAAERTNGTWQVQMEYQGRRRYIGTFPTLEQACLASDIARNMFEKDKALKLSAEECERNFKLAKDAAWNVENRSSIIKPHDSDSTKEEPSENRDGGLSRQGRKRKLSKKKVDSLDIDEEMRSIGHCQPTPTKRKRAGRPRSTKSASVSVAKDHRLCSIAGCTKLAQKGGVCCGHGAKVTRRLCTYKGIGIGADGQCPNVVKRGGLCRRHGAFDLPDCSDPFCKRVAQKGDVFCVLHTKSRH